MSPLTDEEWAEFERLLCKIADMEESDDLAKRRELLDHLSTDGIMALDYVESWGGPGQWTRDARALLREVVDTDGEMEGYGDLPSRIDALLKRPG